MARFMMPSSQTGIYILEVVRYFTRYIDVVFRVMILNSTACIAPHAPAPVHVCSLFPKRM